MSPIGRIKSAIRSMFVRTKRGRALVAGYAGRVEKDQVLTEFRSLQEVLKAGQVPTLRLLCDAGLSSPLYGETVQVMMLARYLSLRGHPVELVIIEPPLVATEWRANSDWTAAGFLADQQRLSEILLPPQVSVRVGVNLAEARDPVDTPDVHTIFEQVARDGGAVYHLTSFLLHLLVEESGLPDAFLLSAENVELDADPWPAPYVAWHVRRGLWAGDRDPSVVAIEQDFTALAEMFPSSDLMVFSDDAGIAHVVDVLEQAGLLARFAAEGRRVIGQPESGFASAIPRVLRADFYFQRMGGGIATIAGFSRLPYLMISANEGVHYSHAHEGERILPWATPDQRFVVRGEDAATVRLGEIARRR